MKDESLQLFSCICMWASTDRPKLLCPSTHESTFSQHCPPQKGTSSRRSCPVLPSVWLNMTLGCLRRSTGLPPDQSRLLLCQPGAWTEDLCCLHPPAQTGLKLTIIWVCALIPSDCHSLFNVLWVCLVFFLEGGGRRGTAAHCPAECEQ